MVARETLVFIGPDLGHVRVTAPAGRRKGRIDPRRAPFSLLPRGTPEGLPSQKMPSLPKLRNHLLAR